jgi:hypothetical protein
MVIDRGEGDSKTRVIVLEVCPGTECKWSFATLLTWGTLTGTWFYFVFRILNSDMEQTPCESITLSAYYKEF